VRSTNKSDTVTREPIFRVLQRLKVTAPVLFIPSFFKYDA